MPMLRGAIFDLDGTLLDSMGVWENAGSQYLRTLGIAAKPDLSQRIQTMSLPQAAAYFQQAYGVQLSCPEIMDGINRLAAHSYHHTVSLKSGAAEFLAALHAQSIPLCLATATDRPLAEAALARCGILSYFSAIFTCTEVGAGKDSPKIYRAALQHLQTEKHETPVFEDAIHALKTAKADNFPTVGVADAYTENQAAVQALCDCYLTDYQKPDGFWAFADHL